MMLSGYYKKYSTLILGYVSVQYIKCLYMFVGLQYKDKSCFVQMYYTCHDVLSWRRLEHPGWTVSGLMSSVWAVTAAALLSAQ